MRACLLASFILAQPGCTAAPPAPVARETVPPPAISARPDLVTRRLPLRFLRPDPRAEHGFLQFLRRQLSPEGELEYLEKTHTVIVRDREEHVAVATRIIGLFDYSGLPLPAELRHTPFEVEENAQIVPNLAPR